jgi:hypothetical protein
LIILISDGTDRDGAPIASTDRPGAITRRRVSGLVAQLTLGRSTLASTRRQPLCHMDSPVAKAIGRDQSSDGRRSALDRAASPGPPL